ncbi:FixH family protein [Virgibacillus alimentarius]|uniref:PKD repeat protein n=1 Tax=Virgibacillus alimentarius TaxID=698769 RepID=A0ABS4S5W3_9BACI|nr:MULTISPECIES: FixH family protein [Virgibacillus]MBP2256853.1 PKD repeat protein [Virgibacillus alimentarius]HLR69535.1 FixH family protein [Virgibacillus sp.]
MRRKIWIFLFVLMLMLLAACSDNHSDETKEETEELAELKVDFALPESAEVDEEVELKAIVTYGDEKVKDADEMEFEYWKQGNEDDSTTVEAQNNEDGTYTAKVSFEEDAVYEIYAHTTARDLHTMPKKSIEVGNAIADEHDAHDEHGDHEHENADGLHMHFMEPEEVKTDEEVDLITHLQMDDEPIEKADVQYDISKKDESDNQETAEAEETKAGEYKATHTFSEAGSYTIQIHVEDDDGVKEQEEYKIEVK